MFLRFHLFPYLAKFHEMVTVTDLFMSSSSWQLGSNWPAIEGILSTKKPHFWIPLRGLKMPGQETTWITGWDNQFHHSKNLTKKKLVVIKPAPFLAHGLPWSIKNWDDPFIKIHSCLDSHDSVVGFFPQWPVGGRQAKTKTWEITSIICYKVVPPATIAFSWCVYNSKNYGFCWWYIELVNGIINQQT